MADIMQTLDLDATLAVLQQGVESISMDEAMAMIDSWHQKLQGTEIAQDLNEIKQALMGGNTVAIAKLLIGLGKDTSAAAASATDDVATQVQKLGSVLIQAGDALM